MCGLGSGVNVAVMVPQPDASKPASGSQPPVLVVLLVLVDVLVEVDVEVDVLTDVLLVAPPCPPAPPLVDVDVEVDATVVVA